MGISPFVSATLSSWILFLLEGVVGCFLFFKEEAVSSQDFSDNNDSAGASFVAVVESAAFVVAVPLLWHVITGETTEAWERLDFAEASSLVMLSSFASS